MRVTGVRAYVGLSGVRARMGVIGFLPVIVVRDHVSVIGSCPRERDRVRVPRFGVVAMCSWPVPGDLGSCPPEGDRGPRFAPTCVGGS
jgi:hypothetical protein